jgi:hypothetical protein
MQEEPLKRKPRIPLSSEELYYYKKIKQLRELKQIEDFKKTNFYIILNRINIFFAAFLTYCLFSIIVCCQWEKSSIKTAVCSFDKYNEETKKLSIDEINILTADGELIPIKTRNLYQEPQPKEDLYIGRDFILKKTLKVKLAFDNNSFWHFYTYPAFTVCLFALCMGFFIYNLNRHLNVNGLLTVFGLFSLASLYFVLI